MGKLYISSIDGSQKDHCDLQLPSGDILRNVQHGQVTRGQFVGIWIDYPATLLRFKPGNPFPEVVADNLAAAKQCDAIFQTHKNQILIREFYSSDSGQTFINLSEVIKDIDRSQYYIYLFSSLSKDGKLQVKIKDSCAKNKPYRIISSVDYGKTWKLGRKGYPETNCFSP